MSATMTAALRALREGQWTFDQFARHTARDWRLLAHYLLRRWRVPEAVEPADVEQEMLVECWRAVADWSPEGGAPIAKYVVFRSVAAAKGWIHKQRAAHKRRDKSPSRHPLAEAKVGRGEDSLLDQLTSAPDQEAVLAAKERFEEVRRRARTARELCSMDALVKGGGTVDGAAEVLWADVGVRRRCRLNSRSDARRAVWRATSKLTA